MSFPSSSIPLASQPALTFWQSGGIVVVMESLVVIESRAVPEGDVLSGLPDLVWENARGETMYLVQLTPGVEVVTATFVTRDLLPLWSEVIGL